MWLLQRVFNVTTARLLNCMLVHQLIPTLAKETVDQNRFKTENSFGVTTLD